MTDTGQDLPDMGGLCSIEDLNGFDLHEIRKAIGKPLMAALDDTDEQGMYAFVWRALVKRDKTSLTFAEVQEYPFRVILEAFTGSNEAAASDPTIARSGDA